MPGDPAYEDLVAFFERWPALRGRIAALARDPDIDPADRQTLRVMMHVMDVVGPADLARRRDG